jgi:hypothetical protein
LLSREGDGTRVRLFHREGPHSVDVYAQRAEAFERSWTRVFEAWTNAARG